MPAQLYEPTAPAQRDWRGFGAHLFDTAIVIGTIIASIVTLHPTGAGRFVLPMLLALVALPAVASVCRAVDCARGRSIEGRIT